MLSRGRIHCSRMDAAAPAPESIRPCSRLLFYEARRQCLRLSEKQSARALGLHAEATAAVNYASSYDPPLQSFSPLSFESCWSQGLAELQGKCSPLDDGRDLRRPDGPGPDVGQARVIRLAAVGFRASGAGTLALHDLCCALA